MNWFSGFCYLVGGFVLCFCGSQVKDSWLSSAFLYCAGAIYLLMGLGYLFAGLLNAKSRALEERETKRKAEEQKLRVEERKLRRQWPQVVTTDSDEK